MQLPQDLLEDAVELGLVLYAPCSLRHTQSIALFSQLPPSPPAGGGGVGRDRMWEDHTAAAVSAGRCSGVVVVSVETGCETGCGKTTQLPQYLLEDAVESGQGAQSSIICTQPRRISAVAVAERVAAERGESIGQSVSVPSQTKSRGRGAGQGAQSAVICTQPRRISAVAVAERVASGESIGRSVRYQVRLEARRSRATHLLFCTTGVLLRRLAFNLHSLTGNPVLPLPTLLGRVPSPPRSAQKQSHASAVLHHGGSAETTGVRPAADRRDSHRGGRDPRAGHERGLPSHRLERPPPPPSRSEAGAPLTSSSPPVFSPSLAPFPFPPLSPLPPLVPSPAPFPPSLLPQSHFLLIVLRDLLPRRPGLKLVLPAHLSPPSHALRPPHQPDFLLIVLRDLLPRRPDLKLVLMSATLNADLFSHYFSGAPTLHIPGFTYPVRSYFLEDVLELTGHEVTLYNQVDDYGSEQQWKRRRQMALMEKRRNSLEPSFVQEALANHSFASHSPFVQRSMEQWTGEGVGFSPIESQSAGPSEALANHSFTSHSPFVQRSMHQWSGEGVGFSLIESALEFAVRRGPRLLAQMQKEGGREGGREWGREGRERWEAGRERDGMQEREEERREGKQDAAGVVGSKDAGAVLVFMTGWDDIIGMRDRLREHPLLGDESRVLLLTCHGSMPIDEQVRVRWAEKLIFNPPPPGVTKVILATNMAETSITINDQKLIFNPPPPGVTKVILATNMAETSITINDVALVIDTGKAKETSYDAVNNVPCLLPQWVSKASVKQRRGRAGRVRPGVCFHLYPRPLFAALPDYGQPELLRAPLHSLCLQIKTLGLGNIGEFLGKAIQPPEPLAVDNAIELLEDVGALDEDENLTPLGRHLTALPLEPRVGKMLVMAAVLSCVNPVLTVGATLSEREPWVRPADKREVAYAVRLRYRRDALQGRLRLSGVADSVRLRFAGDDCSDHFAAVRAFEGWVAVLGSATSHFPSLPIALLPHLPPNPVHQVADSVRLRFAGDDCSHHFAAVRAFEGWVAALGAGNSRSDGYSAARAYCFDHFLSHPTMQARGGVIGTWCSSIAGLRRQLLGTLGELGLVDVQQGMDDANSRSNDPEFVRAALLAGLFPGVASAVANSRSNDPEFVRAALLAGLFPGVASAVKRTRSTTYKTEEDGEVNIHQSSVNAGLTRFPYPWLVFNEKIKTTSVFIRDSTGVSDAGLLLFGGPLTPTTDPGYLHMLDGYFEFFMPPTAARSVLGLRTELDSLIQRKLENPHLPLTPEDEAIMGAVSDLLQCEQSQGTFTIGLQPKLAPPKPVKPVRAKAVDMKLEAGKDFKSYVHNNCKIHFLGKPRYYTEQIGTKKEKVYQCTMRLGGAAAGIDFVGEPASTKKVAEWNAAVEAWQWILEYKKVERKEKEAKEEVKKAGRKDRKEIRKANHKMEERWEFWRKKYEEEETAARAAKRKEKGGGSGGVVGVGDEEMVGERAAEGGRGMEEKGGLRGRGKAGRASKRERKEGGSEGKGKQELLPLSQATKGVAKVASKRRGKERAGGAEERLDAAGGGGAEVAGGGVVDGDGAREWADMASGGEEEERGRGKSGRKGKGKGKGSLEVVLPNDDDVFEMPPQKRKARGKGKSTIEVVLPSDDDMQGRVGQKHGRKRTVEE
ncbi:unnamed protein product [Closterium sp. Naga37s-1]|nr:unnamed protein product [Closterium sp. Naga37s-1]